MKEKPKQNQYNIIFFSKLGFSENLSKNLNKSQNKLINSQKHYSI